MPVRLLVWVHGAHVAHDGRQRRLGVRSADRAGVSQLPSRVEPERQEKRPPRAGVLGARGSLFDAQILRVSELDVTLTQRPDGRPGPPSWATTASRPGPPRRGGPESPRAASNRSTFFLQGCAGREVVTAVRAWTRYRWPTTPQTTAGMAGASCPVGAAGCPEQPFPTASERPHSTDPGRQPSRPAASTPRSTDPRQQELTGAGARPVGRKCDVLLLVTLGES